MTEAPVVDVVIAIHDPQRRLDRALASLADPRARVTVVCHGIHASAVEAQVPVGMKDRVRLVEFSDGVRSPAGPFNHGLQSTEAPYVMIMGSDDFLEPEALTRWIDAVGTTGADIQLAPLRHQSGEFLLNPLVRPGRRHRLDPVRDRLFHRTAPLGLIRRSLVPEAGPLTEGLAVGEDLAWSSALWTAEARIDFDMRQPAYVIGADADVRVTVQPRPVAEILAAVDGLLASTWATEQPSRVLTSLVAKLLRVNILGLLAARPDAAQWPDDARRAVAATLVTLEAVAPPAFDDLPRGARDLLDVAAVAPSAEAMSMAITRYRSSGRVARLVPRRISRALGRESVLRRYVRYAMGRRI